MLPRPSNLKHGISAYFLENTDNRRLTHPCSNFQSKRGSLDLQHQSAPALPPPSWNVSAIQLQHSPLYNCLVGLQLSRAACQHLPASVEAHAAPSRPRSPPRKTNCPNYTAITLIAHNVPVHTPCKPTQSFFPCFRYPTSRHDTLLPPVSPIVHVLGVTVLSWLVGSVPARMQVFALPPNGTPGRFTSLLLLNCR
jgi:hypothetical protein